VVSILPDSPKYQLKLPSSSSNLALIRDFVTKVALQIGFDGDEAGKIELAVDEACTNVIKHAYGDNSEKQIDIVLQVKRNELIITVSDTGKGFDPSGVQVPDLNKSIKSGKRGGLGICLIKTLMDQVDFQIKPGSKNQVKMTKKLNSSSN